jgi:hypothetical protein
MRLRLVMVLMEGSTTQHILWQELLFIRCSSHLTPWLELLK